VIHLHDNIYAGIDKEGGHWLGVRRDGKFGFLTNFKQNDEQGMITRGFLVGEYLQTSSVELDDYLNGNNLYADIYST